HTRFSRDWSSDVCSSDLFDFLGVLLQHNEIQVIKIEELADFVRESCSQFFRFAARSDRLADAHNGLITAGVAQRRNDRVCTHSRSEERPVGGGGESAVGE